MLACPILGPDDNLERAAGGFDLQCGDRRRLHMQVPTFFAVCRRCRVGQSHETDRWELERVKAGVFRSSCHHAFTGGFTTIYQTKFCHSDQRRAEVRWNQANLQTWQMSASHQPHIGPITGMQYLPGREDLMFSCGADGCVRLWDSCMQELCLLEPFSVGINCMDLCPAKPSVLAVCFPP